MLQRYFAEFLGTFLLVFTICLTPNPFAIGLIFIALVYMAKNVSGSHFNPAVTFAVLLKRKMEPMVAGIYMLSQCLGAFLASEAFYLLFKSIPHPKPLASIGLFEALLIEIIFTFIFVATILTVTSEKLVGNHVYGLVIGLTLTGIIFAGGEVSGGAFNPAIGIGQILIDTFKGGSSLNTLWIYIVGPMTGGALAMLYTCWNCCTMSTNCKQ